MTFSWRQFGLALRLYKDGIIIGAVVGAIAAFYASSQGVGISEIVSAGEGLIDDVFGRSASLTQIALYKLYGTFIILGATIGFFADMLVHRFGLFKKR